ncbi:MAG: DUF4839 domain-containing protein [Clostridiales bacterium]|nr:MAG: DUF4839 domain-containing protein [Clostridiales bacterium]
MKKIFPLCLAIVAIVLIFAKTGRNLEVHDGEAKTPSGSSIQHGRNYEDVYKDFEKAGFTNIQLEKIDDLITGWLTKDGEVEAVSVDGNSEYSPDKWYPSDVAVVITYHTFPDKQIEDNNYNLNTSKKEDTETLTVENCEDLAKIFSITANIDPAYSEFAEKYHGRIIEFDGRVDYIDHHSVYNPFNGTTSISDTTYDILLSYGDYDADYQIGPTIRIESVTSRTLGCNISKNLPSFMNVGSNVHVCARIGSFDENIGIFTMYYESIEAR